MTATALDVPCPNCGTPIVPGTSACQACQMRLLGPDAARLWQLQQAIEAYRSESNVLIARLLAPEALGANARTAATSAPAHLPHAPVGVEPLTGSPYDPGTAPAHTYARAPQRSTPSGQQLLLGLGALLVLSAASFFLLVVWMLVGLLGQALILATLTGTAVAASALATRKQLPAAAETAAVIATGLTGLGLFAAWSLNLAGLRELSLSGYGTAASMLGAGIVLAADRAVPRTHAGQPLRRILTYRPAALTALTLTPWLALLSVEPDGAFLVGGLLLVVLVNAVTATAAAVLDPWTEPVTPSTPGSSTARAATAAGHRRVSLSAVPAVLGTLLALVAFALVGLGVSYDHSLPTGDRYGSALLLAAAGAALAGLSLRRSGPGALSASTRSLLPAPATAILLAAAGAFLVDAAWPVLVVASLLASVGVLLLARMQASVPGLAEAPGLVPARTLTGWPLTGTVAAALTAPVLAFLLTVLHFDDDASLSGELMGSGPGVWVPALAFAAWALASAAAAAFTRRSVWVLAVHTGLAVAVGLLLVDSGPRSVAVVGVLGTLACLSVARYSLRHVPDPIRSVLYPLVADHSPGSSFPGTLPRPAFEARRNALLAMATDRVSVAFAALYALAGVAAALSVDDDRVSWTSLALVLLGLFVLGYASEPRRLPVAYVGSVLISAGVGMFVADAGVDAVEVFTLPLAAMLAGIGVVQWNRASSGTAAPAGTPVTMGPALSVALMPTLLVAVGDGDALRLGVVSCAAIALLLWGLSSALKAPVVSATVVLVLVALTQGGPYIAYLPGWLTIGAAGAALLTAGVSWEKAVLSGRRANAWFHTLR